MPIRINKFLSEAGYCSRREADRLIEQERVTIHGVAAQKGSQVEFGDIVKVDGKPIVNTDRRIYLAFNKPKGITSTSDPKIKDNIIDYINYPTRIFHVGRLDKDSEGLILLTNDGDIVNEILRVENDHEKEYVVMVDRDITDDFLNLMMQGVPILNTVTKPCKTVYVNSRTFNITLKEGMNRQIRRMCKHFGYKVLGLKRIRIMHMLLDIPTGQYRHLRDDEREMLLKEKTRFDIKHKG